MFYFTGGEDYKVPPNQYIKIVFLAGNTRAKFDLYLIPDHKIEMTERLRVTIVDLSISYGSNLRLGSVNSATIDILDDDSKHTYYIQHIKSTLKGVYVIVIT